MKKSASDLVAEYIPFTAERDDNRAELRKYLGSREEPQFIAIHFGKTWIALLMGQVPERCYISSAEVFDMVTINAFVKENPDRPAIGFVRVRIRGDIDGRV